MNPSDLAMTNRFLGGLYSFKKHSLLRWISSSMELNKLSAGLGIARSLSINWSSKDSILSLARVLDVLFRDAQHKQIQKGWGGVDLRHF